MYLIDNNFINSSNKNSAEFSLVQVFVNGLVMYSIKNLFRQINVSFNTSESVVDNNLIKTCSILTMNVWKSISHGSFCEMDDNIKLFLLMRMT